MLRRHVVPYLRASPKVPSGGSVGAVSCKLLFAGAPCPNGLAGHEWSAGPLPLRNTPICFNASRDV